MRRTEGRLRAGALAALGMLLLGACAAVNPPRVVPRVDLARYMGTWYEIARFPFRVQEGCFATRATYALRPDGNVDVTNECRKGGFDGEPAVARAVARVADPETNAKLKVTFFPPFSGDYWIVELAEDYRYAVVSGPDRKYLWILSRSPTMPEPLYQELVGSLKERGFAVERLLRTPQRTEGAAR